jgi:hypothetical protein
MGRSEESNTTRRMNGTSIMKDSTSDVMTAGYVERRSSNVILDRVRVKSRKNRMTPAKDPNTTPKHPMRRDSISNSMKISRDFAPHIRYNPISSVRSLIERNIVETMAIATRPKQITVTNVL